MQSWTPRILLCGLLIKSLGQTYFEHKPDIVFTQTTRIAPGKPSCISFDTDALTHACYHALVHPTSM